MLIRLLLTKDKISRLISASIGMSNLPRMAGLCILAAILPAAVVLGTQETAGSLSSASEDNVTRLSPDAFDELPGVVREDLKKRGCTIPQAFHPKSLNNVILGRFTQAKTQDIAVLCSRQQISSILVFRSGLVERVDELAPQPDRSYLQEAAAGSRHYYFSRRIVVASPQTIRRYHEWYEDIELPVPPIDLPPLDHDGIDDNFLEKASVIWYWREGQWMGLPGAD